MVQKSSKKASKKPKKAAAAKSKSKPKKTAPKHKSSKKPHKKPAHTPASFSKVPKALARLAVRAAKQKRCDHQLDSRIGGFIDGASAQLGGVRSKLRPGESGGAFANQH